MQVCVIYDGDYPWDVRIEKMATTLIHNGYEVHLICRNLNKKPLYELFNKIHIHRLPAYASNFATEWLSFPAFFNPVWLSMIRQIIKNFSIDLIVVRDLPLALAATMMGKAYGLPVIFDMAENYPAMLYDIWKYDRFRFANIFVRNPTVAKAIEMFALKTATQIMVVIEESKDRLVQLGLAESSISIVSNTPVLNGGNHGESDAILRKKSDLPRDCPLNLIYVGGLEPMRGLTVLIQTVPQLIEQVPQLKLTIVGGGRWQADLQSEVDRLGLRGYITLTGRLPYDVAMKRVEQSDAGIIPHRVTRHTSSTIPNKLFEYMMNGIPVIATAMAPVKRVIENAQCGYVYSNSSELVSALKKIADKDNRMRLRDNALEAARARYNWQTDEASFLQAIQSALHRMPPTHVPSKSVAR